MTTKKPTEEFEEWWTDHSGYMFKEYIQDYYAGMFAHHIKSTWNHQQEKINTLTGELCKNMANTVKRVSRQQDKIDQLEKKLEIAVSLIESYCYCSSMGASDGQCCFCDDLSKIKETKC